MFIKDRRVLGSKEYEMKDHLGNVRLVFSDRKTPADLTSYAPYSLELRSLNNYYSFGSLQSGQSYQSGKSRYGFNGMEMDNELGITGKSYTTEFREYNAGVGRWWSPDPKPTASESYYVAFGNNPIANVDPKGDWYWVANNNLKISNDIKQINHAQTTLSKIDHKQALEINNQLNSLVKVWNDPDSPHYAPKIAEYVSKEENRIPVAIGNIIDKAVGGYTLPQKDYSNGIKNPIVIKQDMDPATVLHETIHNNGGSEFDAYSGMMAAGYGEENLFQILSYKDNWMNGEKQNKRDNANRDKVSLELYQSFPESSIRNIYFNDVGAVKNPKELIKFMKNYGEKVVGREKNE
ncbi:MAG: hypothetical protein A2X64_08065 [Ignavibacteria bacterium GWF2_33_9]|nr:MAG: hypothetical protein A2X64_08065 [Ignavibacteria bacterium GWF2_33_9]